MHYMFDFLKNTLYFPEDFYDDFFEPGHPRHLGCLKIVFKGDDKVGMSNVISRMTDGAHKEGMSYIVHSADFGEDRVKLQIWDHPHLPPTSLQYYHTVGTHLLVLCFDLSNRASFDGLHEWLEDFDRYCPPTPVLLMGTKCDLERTVAYAEARDFAEANHMRYIETSAKDNTHISEALQAMIYCAMEDALLRGRDINQASGPILAYAPRNRNSFWSRVRRFMPCCVNPPEEPHFPQGPVLK